jgi:hypothetical protein
MQPLFLSNFLENKARSFDVSVTWIWPIKTEIKLIQEHFVCTSSTKFYRNPISSFANVTPGRTYVPINSWQKCFTQTTRHGLWTQPVEKCNSVISCFKREPRIPTSLWCPYFAALHHLRVLCSVEWSGKDWRGSGRGPLQSTVQARTGKPAPCLQAPAWMSRFKTTNTTSTDFLVFL